MWKIFFYYTRRQQRGFLLLAFLIVLTVVFFLFLDTETNVPVSDKELQAEAEYEAFRSSLTVQKENRKNISQKENSEDATLRSFTPFCFDPNTIDSAAFMRLGFSSWMASNVMRYRQKKGRFRRPEDLRKIYGMTDAHFRLLQPYIRIASPVADKTRKKDSVLHSISSFPRKYESLKYAAGTVVDLNKADTSELKKIPGIGSVTARRIVDYRERLGGFFSVEQLKELSLDVEQFRSWFRVGDSVQTSLLVNRLTVKQLMRHPYLNFYQAKVIYEHRQKNGRLHTLKELSLYEEFTPSDLERLSPYVSFE